MRLFRESGQWQRYDIALTVANLLLLGYIIHLLLVSYNSQKELRHSSEIRIIHDTQKQAGAVGYFFSERQRDIDRLCTGPAIVSYFENKALGMSREYGLSASLDQMRGRLNAFVREESVAGKPIFVHLHLAESDGTVLAEVGDALPEDPQQPPAPSAEAPNFGPYRIAQGNLIVTRQIFFKDKVAGTIMAWVAIEPVLKQMVRESDDSSRHWLGLYAGDRLLYSYDPGRRPDHLPPAANTPAIATVGEELVCLAAIPDTGMNLVISLPVRDVFGLTSPLQQLIGVGAVLTALLFGLSGFLRHTIHKRMTFAIHESEERLSLALDSTNDGVWDWNYKTGTVYFSPRWFEMIGYAPGEFPPSLASWTALVLPEDMPAVQTALREHIEGKTAHYISEYRFQTKSGGWIWIMDRGRVISRDEAGNPLRIIGTHTDISAQKNAERLLAETNRDLELRVRERTAMLLQAEKLASIGQLAAGVAHEINNPAGFVIGNLNVLTEYVNGLLELTACYERTLEDIRAGNLDPTTACVNCEAARRQMDLEYLRNDILNLLRESQDGMKRIAGIVSDLKDFSHVNKDDSINDCDLNDLIDKAVSVAWNELKYKCEISREYAALPPVMLNGGQISQVMLNLLINAAQAIDKFGKISIRTKITDADAVVEIEDNGSGIPDAIKNRIFDPFFTTKPIGKGTGLGLHICQKIINSHDGSITIESKEGIGTRVVVRLPRFSRSPAIV